ncbi:hypothetical protein [Bradyrhizobium oligotrophicum]|uniref:hypothetical protein n=1 Tax=Bradyrhizobium oligotrophicum TaxID=44255 RepID=UPI003EB7701A
MAVMKADPAYAHRWLVSVSADTVPVLGAQFSEKPDADLTIYWSGHPGRKDLFLIIDECAGFLMKERSDVEGRLVAFGQDMRAEFELKEHYFAPLPESSVIKDKDKQPLDTFDACRVELTTPRDKVVVWANVTGATRGGLDKGGENIGITLSPRMFENGARVFIEHAIKITSNLAEPTISTLLDKFTKDLLYKKGPATG